LEETMRIRTIMMIAAAVMGPDAHAAAPGQIPATKVAVCVEDGRFTKDWITTHNARWIASKMFAGIGVIIDWRQANTCPNDAIRVNLTYNTPENLFNGALA